MTHPDSQPSPGNGRSESDSTEPATTPEKPPRAARTMAIVRWIILGVTAAVAAGSWWALVGSDRGASVASVKYQCPMHPQIVSDHPGECPICHMTLEPVLADRLVSPPGAGTHSHSGLPPASATSHHGYGDSTTEPRGPIDLSNKHYACPMHPEVLSDKPGRCPICHMDLVPSSNEPNVPSSAAPPTGSAQPPGTTSITLALDRVQAIGVRTSLVQERPSSYALRVTATVSAPDQNIAEVHVRTPGFVEILSVREVGVAVRQGEVLASIYSPEIYQAENELLATRDWTPAAGGGSAVPRADGARRKLELLGVSTAIVDRVLATGRPVRAVGINAPIRGVVTKKNVVLGSYVTPEMVLYEIVDLSRVYILADVFPLDATRITPGMIGRFTSATRNGTLAEAKVDLIYPEVNTESRTVRVRLQLANDKLGLLPGEYGYVEFASSAKTVLLVPRDAVVETGRHTYVFVEEEPGKFVPRNVTLGAEQGENFEVRSGVSAGERVVSGATFLIDSESRLQASLAGPMSADLPVDIESPACDVAFDPGKYPDKRLECRKCEQLHQGKGSTVDDCKRAIPQPWR